MIGHSTSSVSNAVKQKVLMTDHPWPEVRIEREILTQVPADLIVAEGTDAASLTAAERRTS
jgi:hypothetical protein